MSSSNAPQVLILNGSPSGAEGNCSSWGQEMIEKYGGKFRFELVHLSSVELPRAELEEKMNQASGFIFLTGTYWDSWGSPLQKFLEDVTPLEGTSTFLGKPAVVCVLMHSVGGKGVLSRLQGVLNTLGFLIPPQSGMVYSLVNKLALETSSTHAEDFWSKEDLFSMFQNLNLACRSRIEWAGWAVDRRDPRRRWFSES